MGLIAPMLRPRNELTTFSPEVERFLRGGYGPTASGVSVTQETAITFSALFDGVRIISEDIGKLPYPVYRKLGGDQRERAETSPYWRLVHDRAFGGINTFGLSSQQFRELLTGWAVLRGNGYAFKSPAGLGQVQELIPINPSRVQMEQLADGEVIYHVTMANGQILPHTRRDIFHLAGFGLSGIGGADLVQLAKQSIGLGLAQEEYSSRIYSNGGAPRGFLKTPNKLTTGAIDRLTADFDERYGGLANVHKIGFLEEGLDWVSAGMTQEDAQAIEFRQFSVTEMARWLRLPPHMLGDLTHATFTNIEQEKLSYVTDTLMAWGVRWDNAINQQVIGQTNFYAELLFEGLLRGDTKSRYEAYQSAIMTGWMNRNEARRRENLNTAPLLDEFLAPLNMQPAGTANATDNPEGEPVTLPEQVNAVGILIRSGFDAEASVEAVGLDPIEHTGLLPVTVQRPDAMAGAPVGGEPDAQP